MLVCCDDNSKLIDCEVRSIIAGVRLQVKAD